MSGTRLHHLAVRVRPDRTFLAHALTVFGWSRDLNDASLAAFLGLTTEGLDRLALCRAPRADHEQADLARIATATGCRLDALTTIVAAVGALYQRLEATKQQGGGETHARKQAVDYAGRAATFWPARRGEWLPVSTVAKVLRLGVLQVRARLHEGEIRRDETDRSYYAHRGAAQRLLEEEIAAQQAALGA